MIHDGLVTLWFDVLEEHQAEVEARLFEAGAFEIGLGVGRRFDARGIHDVGRVLVRAHFQAPLQAAIFLASQSADKARAAQFKMFWSGE